MSSMSNCFFFFSDLPEVKTITVQIYKEADGKNKKEKRKPIGNNNYLIIFIWQILIWEVQIPLAV